MGWSSVGTAFAVAFLAPGLALLAWPPRTPIPSARVAVAVTVAERVGQAAFLAVLVLSGAAFDRAATPVLAAAVVATLAYLALWVRWYALGGRDPAGLFRPFAGVPVPLAVLPVVALGLLAAWGHSGWLLCVAAIFGGAHLAVSYDVAAQLATNTAPPTTIVLPPRG